MISNTITIPMQGDNDRLMPRSAIQCALFRVGTTGQRATFEKLVLNSAGGVTILFTGTELRSDDQDVLMALFHHARKTVLTQHNDSMVRISSSDLLTKLDWPSTGKYYKNLSDALDRLQRATIRVEYPHGGDNNVMQGNLIRKFYGTDNSKKYWQIHLETEVCAWLALNPQIINWEERARLRKPLAKWLHSFMSSFPHMSPVFSAPEEIIYQQCGSKAKTLRAFRSILKEALEQMKEQEVIAAFAVVDGMVFISRDPTVAIERLPAAARTRFELEFATQQSLL